MEVSEIRRRKAILEERILELVNEFETDCEVDIDSILVLECMDDHCREYKHVNVSIQI